ncbi:MAG: dTMP kinase [Spirochaetia bacterium]|nr:MAG: dTMP kinase [Spirochaetia bacterium]
MPPLFATIKLMGTKGKFIVFEGLDGSGQSTQAQLLKDYLEKEKNISVLLTKEPTNEPPIGVLIRQVLKKEISASPAALQLLFCADRSEHLEKIIKPAIEKGQWVISDRYFYSTMAYGSLGSNIDWLIKINEDFLKPDITFLLKVNAEICVKRIDENRGKREFFEENEKLKKVWQTYEILSKRFSDIKIIDGEKSVVEVADDIKENLLELN